jgi:hypothetical protein
MSKVSMGDTVRITNKFDRLFFNQVGTIAEVSSRAQTDNSNETNYYVQASDISFGRWFRRGEFEIIGGAEGE